MVSQLVDDICVLMTWTEEVEDFQINKGWIAGAFFLGLFVGGGIAALLVPTCLKDWEKKKFAWLCKRQDKEESLIEELERENTQKATPTIVETTEDDTTRKKGRFAGIKAFVKGKIKRGGPSGTTETQTDNTGWVKPDGDDKTPDDPPTVSVGMVTILTKKNSGEADADLVKEDLKEVKKMDKRQKKDKDDLLLKMLKVKLRKMKGKGQSGDPYLQDFTQKVMDMRKSSQSMLNQELMDGEEELKKKYPKNPELLEDELQNLQLQLDAKKRQLEKDEMEGIRGELLRGSGFTEAEVDDLLERLKQNLTELERRQGIEQARQARHLAERLEKRRHLLEFRKLQKQQSKEKLRESIKALEDPINKLIDEGKLTDKQKNDILNQHEKNMLELQKKHEIDAMRLQADLADKLQKRREARMNKLQDKHEKEKANYMDRAEKSSNTEDILNTYQDLVQQQQAEMEEAETELDQTEIQELEKLTQTLEQEKEKDATDMLDKTLQTIRQAGQLAESDVSRVLKLHDLRMKSLEEKRREERERMRAQLQEKWQQRMNKLQEEQEREAAEKESMLEQQDSMVRRVLSSNLELTEEAKEKVLLEHERNMEALNNQISRSKFKQQLALEQKLSQRRARLAELQAQQEELRNQRQAASERELQKLQEKLDQEILNLEKERKAAEDSLRRQLALETQTLLNQQEHELAALIGRLEVGHARRQAVLQKQDKTLKELQNRLSTEITDLTQLSQQEQLEKQVESGRLSSMWADQIIQQHYNQVEQVNNRIQNNRERQEQLINEKVQAKKFQRQRELEDQLAKERQEVAMMRKQTGTSKASVALNKILMETRQKKAMEELEKEMQIELERNREKLNNELQSSLEKELEAHKGEFLNQLAAASKMTPAQMQDIAQSAVQDTGADRLKAKHLSKDLQAGVERAKSSLGMMDDDEDSDGYTRPSNIRPKSGHTYERTPKAERRKKHILRHSEPPKARPAFQASTGEKIHGMWDDDDDIL